MIYLSEWLPNPIGPDAAGEWVELWNGGMEPASISGWTLSTGKGRPYRFADIMLRPGEYRIFSRKTTGLSLVNDSGMLELRDATGHAVDNLRFIGTAANGMSANRAPGGIARFAAPTPGASNIEPELAAIAYAAPPLFAPRSARDEVASAAIAGAALAMVAATAVVLLFRHSHDLSERIFN